MHYTILYRGPLSSCNYGCDYCPFAKRSETLDELAGDRASLARFVDWVADQGARGHELSILFTPWGEALIRSWYQDALVRLTNLPHVRKAAIQTNLSCSLDWIGRSDLKKLGLWCSYHPNETTRQRFVAQCRRLSDLGVRYSVGVVGLKEHLAEAQTLRDELPDEVYLWINAFKRLESYYTADEIDMFTSLDPLFPINNTEHPSFGKPCRSGDTVFSVDAAGTMRRCHFIAAPIGNIYSPGWEESLRPAACTNHTCGCHIGYVHIPELGMDEVFGEGILERIPIASRLRASSRAMSSVAAGAVVPKSRVRMSLRQVMGG